MRYIPLKEAKPGMQLACGLYDSYGRTLVGSNCKLTAGYIEKLCAYGFDGVYIEDELSRDIQVEPAISPKLRIAGMACVRTGDIDGCQRVARKIIDEIIDKGVMALDLADLRTYDDYTYAHSVNVAVFCCAIGLGMDLCDADLNNLVTAALLHDLGKLKIPNEILNKPGRLTQEEYQIMKSHALLSYECISERWDIPSHIKTAVLFHHENVDGSGYPQGLDGKEQTIFTKILHVADVYDALISKRPYKKPYAPSEASEYLMGGCGIMFDRTVVDTLLKYVPLYPKGTKVTLSDGREGIIYENSGLHNLRPVVRLMDGTMVDLAETKYFNLTLLVPEEMEQCAEAAEQTRNAMIQPVQRYRILVVDANGTDMQVLQKILEHLYDLILVKSGEQALLYLKKNPAPDLVLMDIEMPDMNGIEAAKRVQEMTGGKVPILFVTALCDKETVMVCRNMQVAGYIVRPYKPVYVKSEIKRILTGRSEIE